MPLAMPRPTKHPKTGIYLIRKVVPQALRRVANRREWIENLGTKDPAEAARRAADALKRIEAKLAAARAAAGPEQSLSFREIQALCGVWYRREVAEFEDDPGDPEGWDAAHDVLLEKLDRDPATDDPIGFDPKADDLAEARRFLAEQGIAADAESVRSFAVHLFETKRLAAATLRRRAEGDYSTDPALKAFPDHRPAAQEAPKQAKPEPLTAEALLTAWAAERNPSAATRNKYAGTFRQIARILGFDDVRRITVDDVVRFKQARIAEGKNLGTIADDVLAAGAVCKWAVKNRLLTDNPFAGLAPSPSTHGEAARDGYTDEEAKRILAAARQETDGLLRWLPWLLAFTGARISEIVEMRRRDVREEAGVPILDIRPTKAREGKNPIFQRMLPIHPAVLAEGFLAYVESLPKAPDGPLFPNLSPNRGTRAAAATTILGRWIRKKVGITDPRKAPNHSWRHRMEDELRKVRALPEVQDAITGRKNARNAGAGYGKGFRGMPDEVLKDLARIPSPIQPPGSKQAGKVAAPTQEAA